MARYSTLQRYNCNMFELSASLPAHVLGYFNKFSYFPALWRYCRSFQWRWEIGTDRNPKDTDAYRAAASLALNVGQKNVGSILKALKQKLKHPRKNRPVFGTKTLEGLHF